jgi:TPR repeat protein
MVEREASGPTREAGLRWLRKAAEAGDAEAGRTLDGLGGR